MNRLHVSQIVHNYGHGGNGFTLSWGSAERVRELVHAHCPSRETRSHL
jgi:glycine/D-amino acid oxidase-like deaminating enzyme